MGSIDSEVLAIKIANFMLQGLKEHRIAKLLKDDGVDITWRQVKRIMETPRCKDLVVNISKDLQETLKRDVQAKLHRLGDLAVEAIVYQLKKKHSIQAAQQVLKSMGLDVVDSQKQAQNITVLLPSTGEKPIEVRNEIQNITGAIRVEPITDTEPTTDEGDSES